MYFFIIIFSFIFFSSFQLSKHERPIVETERDFVVEGKLSFWRKNEVAWIKRFVSFKPFDVLNIWVHFYAAFSKKIFFIIALFGITNCAEPFLFFCSQAVRF